MVKEDKIESIQEDKDVDSLSPVSVASVLITLVVIIGLSFVSVYSRLLRQRPEITLQNIPSSAAIATFLILLLVKKGLGSISKIKIQNGQISSIYWMVSVGALLLGTGFLYFNIFPIMGFQEVVYFGLQKTYAPLLDGFSSLVLPKDTQVAYDFWMGGASVPWGDWIMPMIMWVLFFSSSMIFLACISSFVYHRWTNVELLTFPLAIPISEMLKEVPDSRKSEESIWYNKVGWIGMFIGAVIIGAPPLLRRYFPMVPVIHYNIDVRPFVDNLPVSISQAILRDWPPLPDRAFLKFNPFAMSIGLLVSKEISFSIWFCAILLFILRSILNAKWGIGAAGAGAASKLDAYVLEAGAFLGLTVWLFYSVRREFSLAFKAALGKEVPSSYSERDPMISPKNALIFGTISLIFMFLYTSILLHINVLIFLFFVIITVAVGIGWARVRAEAGLPSDGVYGPFGQHYEYLVIERLLGRKGIGDSSLAGLHFMAPFSYGRFLHLPGIFVEGSKVSESLKVKKESLVKAMIFIGIVAMIMGYLVALPAIYTKGAYNIPGFGTKARGTWFTAGFVTYGQNIMKVAQPWRVIYLAIGAGGVLFLTYLRALFAWWPISPVGFLFMWNEVFPGEFPSFFVAWLVKMLVLRWSGVSGAKALINFSVGLVIGQVGVQTFFTLLGMIIGR